MECNSFPYKDAEGNPNFRKHQQNACEGISKLLKTKRAVVLNAPVGSGKSVINYTVAMNQGRAVYITAQKSLQDQIEAENWPGVKNLKGRNAYLCTAYCDKIDNMRCDDRRDSVKTCHNSKTFKYQVTDGIFNRILNNVEQTNSKYDGVELKMRTSFKNKEDILAAKAKYGETAAKPEDFIKKIACNILPVECPVKSSRLVAQTADMVVANPDLYYNLNMYTGYFEEFNTMIVDEAHRMEDAIQRLFRVRIPLKVFKDCFGIDFSDIKNISKIDQFHLALAKKMKDIIPLFLFCELVNKYGEVAAIYDEDSMAACAATDYVPDEIVSLFKNNQHVSVLDKLSAIFEVNDKSIEMGGGILRMDVFDNFMKHICDYADFSNDDFDISISDKSFRLNRGFKKSRSILVKTISTMYNDVSQTMQTIIGMIGIKHEGKYSMFIKDIEHSNVIKSVMGTKLQKYHKMYKENDVTDVLVLIPMHIGSLMQKHFFMDKKVILGSGTWPDKEGQIRGFGFKKGEVSIYNVPTTFPIKNRPVYINSNSDCMDFSCKLPDGEYFYKTSKGVSLFNADLKRMIDKIRSRRPSYNIAIHTFSFAIANLIADNYKGDTSGFLFHISSDHPNKLSKEEAIYRFTSNPDSGKTIVSPSITEGLDFKDGICRAQIILKAPIPNMGDQYNKYRTYGCPDIGLAPDRSYIDRKSAIDIIQTYGRVVRSETDYGDTYIYDLALTKRMSKMFIYRHNGRMRMINLPEKMKRGVPGDMSMLDMSYIKPAVKLFKDQYDRLNFSVIL